MATVVRLASSSDNPTCQHLLFAFATSEYHADCSDPHREGSGFGDGASSLDFKANPVQLVSLFGVMCKENKIEWGI